VYQAAMIHLRVNASSTSTCRSYRDGVRLSMRLAAKGEGG
jgi:hypothetical protein